MDGLWKEKKMGYVLNSREWVTCRMVEDGGVSAASDVEALGLGQIVHRRGEWLQIFRFGVHGSLHNVL